LGLAGLPLAPPPPPPDPPPPPRPYPPENEGLGSNCGGPGCLRGLSSAGLTLSFRPPNSCSSNCFMASSASSELENSTKANPLGRPVARSVGRKTSLTSPAPDKSSESCSLVVS
jgi:hypothetical protein